MVDKIDQLNLLRAVASATAKASEPAQVAAFQGRARVALGSFARGIYDPYLKAAWNRGGLTVVIDDLRLLLMHGSTDIVEQITIAGRERFIGCWSNMQRPVRYLEIITESEWLFAFALQMEKDRNRCSERGVDFSGINLLPKYHYVVHRRGWRQLKRMDPVKLGRIHAPKGEKNDTQQSASTIIPEHVGTTSPKDRAGGRASSNRARAVGNRK
jgi:hypothetical protein